MPQVNVLSYDTVNKIKKEIIVQTLPPAVDNQILIADIDNLYKSFTPLLNNYGGFILANNGRIIGK